MTPRYEYTWGGGNFFLAASLRTYCYTHCYCSSMGKTNTNRLPKLPIWQFLRNNQLLMHKDGSIDYGKRLPMPSRIFRKIATVLPPQDGPDGPTSGTCGADGKQFCPAPWPANLGPIPRAPPYSTEVVQPPSVGADGTKNLTVCGNLCAGVQDCKKSYAKWGCDCAYPNTEDARMLNLDPVFPPSVCLALDRTTFSLPSSLFGRDEKGSRYVDEHGVPYQCRCNATYTGNECCGSPDGLVWLD